MKLKAPKTWQLIVILITVFVLAIGGSLLAVYFTTGFQPEVINPESISVEDVSGSFNTQLNQYETGAPFSLKITTPTERVNQNEITLGFRAGVATTRSEGKISDGTIIVPERVRIGQEFQVELVQAEYQTKSGEIFTANKGGVSELVILTQNNLLGSSSVKIAVDVPVREIGLEVVDATTGAVLGDENMLNNNRIAEGTHFVLRPTFYPAASQYLFSDDKNEAITSKREKTVFYEVASTSQGVSFVFNNFDPYFVAADETSENNQINGYAFSSAKDQLNFFNSNSQIEGQPLYSEAIRQLTLPETLVAKSRISVNVVEANVGSFGIDTTTAENPIQFTTNRVLKLSARTSSLSDRNININITDIHGAPLSAMIKNVGLRVISVTNSVTGQTVANSLVKVKGGELKTAAGNEYVLINAQVKNLNHANWEISTDGEYLVQMEIVLLVEDEKGETKIFVPEGETYQPKYVYFKSTEGKDDPVDWADGVGNQISMMLIYDAQGRPVVSEFTKDLYSLANVPADNIYNRIVFFAYYDATFGEGESMSDYVDVATDGQGLYTIPNLGGKTLYPLRGSSLIAKDALNFNIVFATIRTDAYGTPIMNQNGTYIVQKWSSVIAVQVEKTLQGFDEVSLKVDNKFLMTGNNFYAVPTQTNESLSLELKLMNAGDEEIFRQEYASRKISFYATEDAEGKIVRNDVFNFGAPQYNGDTVSIPISVRNFTIGEEAGKDFYVRVSYNNSITTNTWVAEPKDAETPDLFGALRIYQQKAHTIVNDTLSGNTFSVVSSLKADGTSQVTVTGSSLNLPTDLDGFNSYIKNTVVYDYYGQAFAPDLILSSSDMSAVSVNNESKTISTLNVDKNGVVITIQADERTISFTLNVQSKNVQYVEVFGNRAPVTSNPKLEVEGLPGSPIYLKNVSGGQAGALDVYVLGSVGYEKYMPEKYDITISPSFLATRGKDSPLWKMFKINGVENFAVSEDAKIESIEVIKYFGQTVTIPFVAKNASNTLDFVFDITFTMQTELKLNNLNAVDYGKGMIGVRESDKPLGATNEQIFVYTAYGIDLNTYFQVENVDWAAAYSGNKNEIEINGNVVAKIIDGKIYFTDVYQRTDLSIRLYAYQNNTFGYNHEINLTVVPNFEIKENRPLHLINLFTESKADEIRNYIELSRIADDTSAAELPTDFTYVIEDTQSFNSEGQPLQYVKVDGGVVKFNEQMNLAYGEQSKTTTVSLKHSGLTVATCSLAVSVGVTQESLTPCGSWLNNFVTYNNQRMLLVSVQNAEFVASTFQNALKASVVANAAAYRLSGSSGSDLRGITFSTSQDRLFSVGERYYLAVHFTNDNNTIATLEIPMIISSVGGKFASYGVESNEDLKQILDADGSYFQEVTGGETYKLVAPDQIDGRDYAFSGNDLVLISNEVISGEGTEQIGRYQITIGGTTYEYTLMDNRLASIGGQVNLALGAGETFTFNGNTYFIRSIENGILSISTAVVGANGRITFADGSEHTYTCADGAFGTILTSFDSDKFITGFKESDFGENKNSFAVPNEYSNIISIKNGELTIFDVVSDKNVDAKFRITVKSPFYSQSLSYDFRLSIIPNATMDRPVYPFGGNTEILEIAQGEIKSIDMRGEFGDEALNENRGKRRFGDELIIGGSTKDVSDSADLSIKKITIDGAPVSIDNTQFVVKIEGDTVTFENRAGVDRVNVVLRRSYTGIYGADFDYYFSINVGGEIEYFAEFSNNTSGNLAAGKWTLANTTNAQTIKVTTKQRTDAGESNVDTSKVKTIMTHNFTEEGYTFDWQNGILSITRPPFVAEEVTHQVFFSVNGIRIATLDVVVPATVNVEFGKSNLDAGKTYSADALIESITAGYNITNIEVVGTDAEKKEANKFFKLDDENSTSFELGHTIEDKQLTLKFTYSGGTNEGYVQKTFTIVHDLEFKESINLGRFQASIREEEPVGNFFIEGHSISEFNGLVEISDKPDEIESVRMSDYNNFVHVKTNFVAVETNVEFVITFVEEFNREEAFRASVRVSMTLFPAVDISVNYPAPAGTELTYETLESGKVYTDFFNGTATFASAKRFVAEDSATHSEGSIVADFECNVLNSENVSVAFDEQKNDQGNPNGRINLTATLDAGAPNGSATIELVYQGVAITYNIYVVADVISGSSNGTINSANNIETVYPDTMSMENLFSVNRLLSISVSGSAPLGQVIYAFKANLENGVSTAIGTSIAKFVLTSANRGQIIFVDTGVGKNVVLADNQTIVFKSEDKPDGATVSGVTFERVAKRVEFKYALKDNPDGLVITHQSLNIVEPMLSWTNNQAMANVQYKITENGTLQTGVNYALVRALDIAADNAFRLYKEDGKTTTIDLSGKTIPELTTTWLNHYRLVELAGLKHPSTGLPLTSSSINSSVELTLEVVDTASENIIASNMTFKYRTPGTNADYLTFTPITTLDPTNRLIYDYYLFAEGCSQNGDYVLVRISYKQGQVEEVEEVEEEFYMIFKLVPGYDVTINGQTIASAGETVNEGNVGNASSPYNFVQTGSDELKLTGDNGLVSVVRRHWNSNNISNTMSVTIKEAEDGEIINTSIDKLKLNLTPTNGVYTLPAGAVAIKPATVVFGEKKFKIDITDQYDYHIEFYFNLIPTQDQTPVIDRLISAPTLIEGQPFDVGVVYDQLAWNSEGDDKDENKTYFIVPNIGQIPDAGTTAQGVFIRNINAWGVSGASDVRDDAVILEKLQGDYVNVPTFAYVKVDKVEFIYDKDTSTTKSVTFNNKSLATASALKYPGIAADKNPYRDIEADKKVPTMPGWIYGTGESATVEVVVTLIYENNGTTESCVISYPVTITRAVQFSSAKKVVVDGVAFPVKDYINVGNRNNPNAETTPTFYQDTLEITLKPLEGFADFTIEFGVLERTGEHNFVKYTREASRSINNTLSRPVTYYYSLSELCGKTLNDISAFKIKFDSLEGIVADGSRPRVRYNGEYIDLDSAFTSRDISIEPVANGGKDTLYIEDAGLLSVNEDSTKVNRYYIIKIGDEYHRYTHEFDLTRRYTYLNDGLIAPATAKPIDNTWTKNSDDRYEVSIEQWAEDVTVSVATDGDQGGIKADDESKTSLASLKNSNIFRFEVGDKDSTAFFTGSTLYTGKDYQINAQEYILINIYVKASGGPEGGMNAWQNGGVNDKLIGQFRIFLIDTTRS